MAILNHLKTIVSKLVNGIVANSGFLNCTGASLSMTKKIRIKMNSELNAWRKLLKVNLLLLKKVLLRVGIR